MSYGNYTTYEEVATTFNIKFIEANFIQEKRIAIDEALFNFINENVRTKRNYVTENAICESIISPILNIVAKHHELPVWSHMRFDVSIEEGLIGVPDFIIAPASDIGTTFTTPIICITEAKKENFNEGWAQVLAEMIAAQKFNCDSELNIFGIVTTGNYWQFGKLFQNLFTMEVISYSATENLQQLFDVLNWVVVEAKSNISGPDQAPIQTGSGSSGYQPESANRLG